MLTLEARQDRRRGKAAEHAAHLARALPTELWPRPIPYARASGPSSGTRRGPTRALRIDPVTNRAALASRVPARSEESCDNRYFTLRRDHRHV